MEGDQEEDSEPKERGASSPQSSILWEKCIQQSIFVDLSEDESLHFSDLEGSFVVCLSQGESAASGASIHLSENAEFSDSGESSSESGSGDSRQSERVVDGRTKSSVTRVSAQRPNTVQEEQLSIWGHQDPGDTSDEDQEDLPYDGDLGSRYINPTSSSEENSTISDVGTLQSSPNVLDPSDLPAMDGDTSITQGHLPIEIHPLDLASVSPVGGNGDSTRPAEAAPLCSSPVFEAPQPDITQLLLRHFSQDELLCSGRLIEAETLPEVSLLESMDETMLSIALRRSSTGSPNIDSGTAPRRSTAGSPCSDSVLSRAPRRSSTGRPSDIKQILCKVNGDRSPNASEGSDRLGQEEEESHNSDITSTSGSNTSNRKNQDSDQDSRGSSSPILSKHVDNDDEDDEEEEGQIKIIPLVRTRSFTEIKYGQGQVHYPPPDFSKVTPKVKIPKSTGNSSVVRPISQSPITILRAQSSPGMLGRSSASCKAAVDVISVIKMLEDTIQPSGRPSVARDQGAQGEPSGTTPDLVHHLQAEYNKLLTKYAEAENLIDQIRLGTKTQQPSDLPLEFDCGDQEDHLGLGSNGGHFGSKPLPTPPLPTGKKLPLTSDLRQSAEEHIQPNHAKQLNPSLTQTQTDQQCQSDGERMTRELTDIISQFMQKVHEFKMCLNTMSISIEEQQMMLKSMMEAQDQLERRYLSTKEEHRALEMQNYMSRSRNTGTFDPERQVEGEIFRIGMHLEDIKELIDTNVCEQLSPPHSSSTPTPPSLSVESCAPCLPTPSPPPPPPPPPPHEGLTLPEPSPCFSTRGYEMVKKREEEEEEEASEVYADDGSMQSCELPTGDSVLNSTGQSSSGLRISHDSLEGLDITTTTEEEEEEEEEERRIGYDSILTCLSRPDPPSADRQWTPERLQQSLQSPECECDLGESVCLAVEVSCSSEAKTQSLSDQTLTTPQRIVSPETDSGFGSSDLSRPATGLSQPKLNTERLQFQCHGTSSPMSISGSDSEASCSNLQTAVHPAMLPGERRGSLGTPGQPQLCSTALDQWVKSTSTQDLPALLQDTEADFYVSSQLRPPNADCRTNSLHSITMDTPQRDNHPHSCSCHNEAILALQSEVSRLKRDLEEGLVQLPHLTQRMDHLTSRYRQERQDRQDRRPKARPRALHKSPTNSSVWKTAGSRPDRQSPTDPNSSLMKIEDWISSDMDPSKSKGTDSGDSVNMQQMHSTPAGGRRGNIKPYTSSDTPGKPQNKKHSGSEENCSLETSDLTHSSPRNSPYRNTSYRTSPGDMEYVCPKRKYSLLSSQPLQKPLLQVNYTSSCSLPACFKVQEQPLQSVSHHRRRSTQSDSALLPSNVYFQRTLPPALSPPRTGSRGSRRRGSKEEDISRTLDKAIETARSMKQTTDRMAKSLSADLAKAELYRKLHGLQPLGGRINTGS